MAEMVQISDAKRVPNSVVTVGTFDGVHAGHRVLIKKVVKKAVRRNARSVIITFDPHPRDIINPGKSGIKLLSTLEERRELLSDIGIDEMIVIPFDRDFSLISSESFVQDIIWKKIGISEFVIGYDHQFGRNREGTIETVQRIAREKSFDVYVVSKQEVGDKTVSSTIIRSALQNDGDVVLANKLLERAYLLNGTVVHGDNRGKKLGFPTANIKPDHPRKVIPRQGVYAVKVRVDRDYFDGMMNIGMRPTFGGKTESLEAHLFGFNRDIYGNSVQVRFMRRIRHEKKFQNPGELKQQLEADKESCKKALSEED